MFLLLSPTYYLSKFVRPMVDTSSPGTTLSFKLTSSFHIVVWHFIVVCSLTLLRIWDTFSYNPATYGRTTSCLASSFFLFLSIFTVTDLMAESDHKSFGWPIIWWMDGGRMVPVGLHPTSLPLQYQCIQEGNRLPPLSIVDVMLITLVRTLWMWLLITLVRTLCSWWNTTN